MIGFSATFKYEFKPDGTFTAPMSEGTYTFTDNSLAVTTTKLVGQDITKLTKGKPVPAMKGELSEDGQSLVLHLPKSPMIPASVSNIKMVPDK